MIFDKLLKAIKTWLLTACIIFIIFGCDSSGGGGNHPGDNSGGSTGVNSPAAPAGITVSAADSQLTVEWQAVHNADKYSVYCGTNASYESAAKKFENITETSKVITGLINETTYYIWVQAHNSIGAGLVSDAVTGMPKKAMTAPLTPENIRLEAIAAGEIKVEWSAVDNASSYYVYYGLTNDINQAIDNKEITDAVSAFITGLANGTAYYIWVTAKNSVGDSLPGEVKSLTTIMPSPVNVKLAAEEAGKIKVEWDSVANAALYDVYYGLTSVKPGSTDKNGITETTLTLTNLDNGKLYYIWVTAKNSISESLPSEVKNLSTIMPSPAGVTAAGGIESLIVNWNSVNNAISYDIYYNILNNPPAVTDITGIDGTSTVIYGLNKNTTYYVWVKAKENNGIYSDYSIKTSASTSIYGAGDKIAITVNEKSFNIICVPGGTFTLKDGGPDMSISKSYWIGETEITQGLWQAVMGNNPSYYSLPLKAPASGETDTKRPVESVTWYDALEFCNKLSQLDGKTEVYNITNITRNATYGYIIDAAVSIDWNADGYRLPSEMEWMWAAIGARDNAEGYKKAFAGSTGSNNIDDYVWHYYNAYRGFPSPSRPAPHQVAKKQPNELGLYDMNGNLLEWCWDLYGDYPGSAKADYYGAESGTARVLRGGAYYSFREGCAIANRFNKSPSVKDSFNGIRIVRNAE